jgi:hypothetical protein
VLLFGNGANGGDANTLYVTVGLDTAGDEGSFGSISAVPKPGSLVLVGIGAIVITAVQFRRRRKVRLTAPTAAC